MKNFFTSPLRVAMFFIFGLLFAHLGLWAGRAYAPGFIGEWCGKIQGFSFTPFFMEIGLIVFGFMAVFVVNFYRQKWEGDELVYLEVVDDPQAKLPDSSRAVIFTERADSGDPLPVSLAAIEGALELKDYQEAKSLLSQLSSKDLAHPSVKTLSEKLQNL